VELDAIVTVLAKVQINSEGERVTKERIGHNRRCPGVLTAPFVGVSGCGG
jgi:hypothetical protein